MRTCSAISRRHRIAGGSSVCTYSIQGTFREHSGNIQGTFREHSESQPIFTKRTSSAIACRRRMAVGPSVCIYSIQGTFRETSVKIQGTFREQANLHYAYLLGHRLQAQDGIGALGVQYIAFREHSGNIQGTFREHSGHIQRAGQSSLSAPPRPSLAAAEWRRGPRCAHTARSLRARRAR
jgi:hypothetical protein